MPPYWKDTKRYKKRSKKIKVKNFSLNADPVEKRRVDATEFERPSKKQIKRRYNTKLVAEGIAIHTTVNARTASSYLKDVNDLNDANLNDRTQVVELARKLRSKEGICATVADLLLDFGLTRGSFYCDNVEFKNVLNRWGKWINSPAKMNLKGIVMPIPGLRTLSRKIVDDYLTDGDCVFSLFWERNVKMDETIDEQALFLPTSARTIDTLTLEIDTDLAGLGIERLTLKLSDALITKIIKPETEADKFLSNIVPKEWKKFINDKEDIVLDPNVTFHIKRNAKDWKAWGESLFLKSFTSIANKRRIQAVDDATIDGLINRFTVFKLGLPDQEKNPAYHIPSKRRVASLVDIVTDPKRANAIVWPGPDLTIEDIGPDGKILEFIEKYQQVDKDILRALHVSPLLIDGASAGSGAKDFVSFISTEVGLDFIRDELEKVYTKIARDIAIANKFDYTILNYKFGTQMLKDEQRVRNFAIKIYELGGISTETFVKTMGYDFEAEKDLKEKETADKLEEIFVNRSIPFQGKPESIDKNDKNDKDDGRPVDTTKEDTSEETTKKDVDIETASIKNTETFYRNLYLSSFKKVENEIVARWSLGSKSMIEMALITGFANFKTLVEIQIKDVFYKTVNVVGGFETELAFLVGWNDKYINKFYDDFSLKLINGFEQGLLLEDILIDNRHRIGLYAKQSHVKAQFVGEVALARLKGKTRGKWLTSNKECAECIKNDEITFSLGDLMDIYPSHPNCTCNITFI